MYGRFSNGWHLIGYTYDAHKTIPSRVQMMGEMKRDKTNTKRECAWDLDDGVRWCVIPITPSSLTSPNYCVWRFRKLCSSFPQQLRLHPRGMASHPSPRMRSSLSIASNTFPWIPPKHHSFAMHPSWDILSPMLPSPVVFMLYIPTNWFS